MADNPFSGIFQDFSVDSGYAPPSAAPNLAPASGSSPSFWDSFGLGGGGGSDPSATPIQGGAGAAPYYGPRAAGDYGPVIGFIDALRGLPSQNQVARSEEQRRVERDRGYAQQTNAEENGLIQDFMKVRQQNPDLPPELAVKQFVTSPQFSSRVMQVPGDRMLKLIEGMKQAASPNTEKLGPGQTIMQEGAGGRFTARGTAPTQEMTNNQALMAMSDQEIEQLRRRQAAMNPDEAKTQTERATAEMTRRGIITEEQRLNINANGTRMQPHTNAAGELLGFTQYDRIGNRVTYIPAGPGMNEAGAPIPAGAPPSTASPFPRTGPGATIGGVSTAAPPPQPAQPAAPRPLGGAPAGPQPGPNGEIPHQPGAPIPPGYVPSLNNTIRPRRTVDMVDAAGAAPVAIDNLGRATSQLPGAGAQNRFDPELNRGRVELNSVGLAFSDFSKNSKEFKSEVSQRAFSSFSPNALLENPASAVVKMQVMHRVSDIVLQTHQQILATRGLAPDALKKSSDEVREALKLKNTLPTPQELELKAAELKAGLGADNWSKLAAAVPGFGDITALFDRSSDAYKKAQELQGGQGAQPGRMTAEQYNALPEAQFREAARRGEITPELARQIQALRQRPQNKQ